MEFSLQSKDRISHLTVDIMERSYPTCNDYWDGNWLNAQISVAVPGYSANLHVFLRTDELDWFLKELLRTHLDLKSTAELQPLETGIELSITPCYPEGIKVMGKTKENRATSAFEFISHHSQLLNLITELEKIMITYPIKRKYYIQKSKLLNQIEFWKSQS